ncbi:hypothetical protein [Emticicia sp. C21]|uniref:hypothetical protein n=1 Tax=Emticicia sp. C21 TaxID=2302915 RepID=UPI000E34171F|nr:hypothetical protein [Emticicia sp. C21]RFS17050.1 hypothetical protein D0T08_10265 [Emticicia sp. C21]
MKALLFFCLTISNFVLAQSVSLSPNQGVKFPQYSMANMMAIASPEKGATIFNTETNTLWTYTGNAWKNLGGGMNGTKIQTFHFNNVTWTRADDSFSRVYTVIFTLVELNEEVMSSGTVDVAYVPVVSNTIHYRKFPEANVTTNFGGTYYTIQNYFSYELNTLTVKIVIPNGLFVQHDYFLLPNKLKATLISPN